MSSNEKFEREFDAFLDDEDSRLAALYRKLPRAEPDARLDAAVRAMAHRALNPQLVATPQAWSPKRRIVRWVPALGAAAGIVLAAGIAFRLGPSVNDANYRDAAPGSDVISVRQLDAPAGTAPPPLSPAPPPAASAPTAAALARPPPDRTGGNGPATPPAPPAPAPVAAAKSIRGQEPDQTQRPSATPEQRTDATVTGGNGAQGVVKAKPAPRPFPPELDHGRPPATRQVPEIDAVERRQGMAGSARPNLQQRDTRDAASNAARARSLDDKDAAPAPKSPAAAAMMPSPVPPAEPARAAEQAVAPNATDVEAERSATIATERLSAPASPPPPAAVRQAPAAAGQVAPQAAGDAARERSQNPSDRGMLKKERAKSDDPNARLYPESWLAKIRRMVEQGQRDEALRGLAEFRRLYPDYRLPDDLRDLK